jgi:hypothetical protein
LTKNKYACIDCLYIGQYLAIIPAREHVEKRDMKTHRFATIAALLASALMAAGVLAAPDGDVEKAARHDGLEKISVEGIDLAYARPGATLAAYNRVRIEPVEVTFSRNWDPKRAGSK